MTKNITLAIIVALLFLFINNVEGGNDSYHELMMKAEALSSERAVGLKTIDALKQNIRERAELMDKAERALAEGRITRDQYDRIMTEIRRPIDRQN